MRALRIIFIAGSLLGLAVILMLGYFFVLRPLTLPVYHLSQRPSDHDSNFTAITLSQGSAVYIHDAGEDALEMTAERTEWNALIGRTEDGMNVYAIPPQNPRDYIMLTTEMFPNLIMRNISTPPVQLATLPVDEIYLFANQNNHPIVAPTRDETLIQEVVSSLVNRQGIVKSTPTDLTAILSLRSAQLPGLAYIAYASANPAGEVFLSQKHTPDDWIPAGPAFTAWFSQTVLAGQ